MIKGEIENRVTSNTGVLPRRSLMEVFNRGKESRQPIAKPAQAEPAEAIREQAAIPHEAEAHKPRSKPASKPDWRACRAKGCAAWIGGPPGPEIAWRCLGEHFHGDVDFDAASFPKIVTLPACPWLN